jgi:hypothetical protein
VVSAYENIRADELRQNSIQAASKKQISTVPNHRFALSFHSQEKLLEQVANSYQGIATSDYPRYGRKFWEISLPNNNWEFQQSTIKAHSHYSGREHIFLWEKGMGALSLNPSARVQGFSALGKIGVAITQTRSLPATIYQGNFFDNNVAAVVLDDANMHAKVWCFCSSEEFVESVRMLDEKLGVTNATLVKTPFNIAQWEKVANEKYPNGLPKPYSDDPTQWLFHGHPCGSVVWDETVKRLKHGTLRSDDTVLQVAVARLLSYRWPTELDAGMELSAEARAWVEKAQSLRPFADDDGIVCLPSVRGEPTAADRLLDLLATAYGASWANDTLAQLLKAADHADKSLESWLRDKFFSQHCKRFHDRPFLWHIWDGLRDGFAALVNYHKLDRKTLETLTYTYVGDWITRQRRDIAAGVDGAQEKLAAAEQLQKRLKLILQGEAPYDIFVRWKALAKQPIGWQPDLNDGVRLNIRPFLSVPDIGKRGAKVDPFVKTVRRSKIESLSSFL